MPLWLLVLAIIALGVLLGCLAWLAIVAATAGPGPQALVDVEADAPRCYCESCRCSRNGVLGLATSCCPRGLTHGALCVCAGSSVRDTQPRRRVF